MHRQTGRARSTAPRRGRDDGDRVVAVSGTATDASSSPRRDRRRRRRDDEPPTRALLNAIQAAPAAEVVVLPNNPNVFMAAEEASLLAGKPVHVARDRADPGGSSLRSRTTPPRPGDEVRRRADRRSRPVRRGHGRSRPVEGFAEEGDFLGLVGVSPSSAAGPAGVAEQVVEALLARAARPAHGPDRRGRRGARRAPGTNREPLGGAWRSTSTQAASRTTGCCSPPSRNRRRGVRFAVVGRHPRGSRRGQRRLPRGARALLGLSPEIETVAALADGYDVAESRRAAQRTWVVMDYRMPSRRRAGDHDVAAFTDMGWWRSRPPRTPVSAGA